LLPDGDGGQTPGFQVHLGGGLASHDREEAGLGRTVRGLKVTAEGIADYVERIVLRFLDERDAATDETFAHWAHRAEEEALV
jgi:sulfite reductase (ferredoxin)